MNRFVAISFPFSEWRDLVKSTFCRLLICLCLAESRRKSSEQGMTKDCLVDQDRNLQSSHIGSLSFLLKPFKKKKSYIVSHRRLFSCHPLYFSFLAGFFIYESSTQDSCNQGLDGQKKIGLLGGQCLKGNHRIVHFIMSYT